MPFIPSLCPLRHCEADMQIEQATMLMPYYLYQPNYFGILLLGGSDCYLANERGFPDLKPLDKFAPSAIHEGSECVVEDLSPFHRDRSYAFFRFTDSLRNGVRCLAAPEQECHGDAECIE